MRRAVMKRLLFGKLKKLFVDHRVVLNTEYPKLSASTSMLRYVLSVLTCYCDFHIYLISRRVPRSCPLKLRSPHPHQTAPRLLPSTAHSPRELRVDVARSPIHPMSWNADPLWRIVDVAGPTWPRSFANPATVSSRAARSGVTSRSFHRGLTRSNKAQKAISESVSPIGRNESLRYSLRPRMSGTCPLCTNTCIRPPSSRAKGCVFLVQTSPSVARRICDKTSVLRISCCSTN